MATLKLIRTADGSREGEAVEVSLARFSIGRAAESSLVLADAQLSGRHASIEPTTDGQQHLIRDAGSRNGTWVNDRQITEHLLRNGDTIRVGETLMTYVTSPQRCCRCCGARLDDDARFCGGCGRGAPAEADAFPRTAISSAVAPAPASAALRAPAPAAPAPGESERSDRHVAAPSAQSAPRLASAPSAQPRVQTPAHESARAAGNSRAWIWVLCIALTVLLGGVGAAYLFLVRADGGAGSARHATRHQLLRKELRPSDVDQIVAHGKEVKVRVPFGLLQRPQVLTVSRLNNLAAPSGKGELAVAYEVTLDREHQLASVLEIEFAHPGATRDALCLSTDKESGPWRSVPCRVNSSRGTVTISTNHLSIFTVEVPKPPEPGPMMRVLEVRYPSGDFLPGYAREHLLRKREFKQSVIYGWHSAMNWFGVGGAATAAGEHAFDIVALKSVNGAMSEMGLAFAFAQAAIDFADGKPTSAVLELIKNTYNYGAAKVVDTKTLNLAFVGVFALDYSLSKFANAAKEGRLALYKKAYQLYYSEHHKDKNSPYWYKRLKHLMHATPPGADIGAVINAELDRHVRQFWSDTGLLIEYMDRVMKHHRFTGLAGLSRKDEGDLSRAQLLELRQRLTPALDKLFRETRLHYQAQAHKILEKSAGALNEVHKIKVVVRAGEPKQRGAPKIGGLAVQIPVRDGRQTEMWKGKTDKEGIFQFRCTTLGYLVAGTPKKVQLLLPPKKAGDKPITLEARLKLRRPDQETVVIFNLSPSGLTGRWRVEETKTSLAFDLKLGKFDEHTKTYVLDFDKLKNGPPAWTVGDENGYVTLTSPQNKLWIKFQGADSFTGRKRSARRTTRFKLRNPQAWWEESKLKGRRLP